MCAITYGLFDVSSLNSQELIGYQYLTNGNSLYGEEYGEIQDSESRSDRALLE